jgi:hypothetical protein
MMSAGTNRIPSCITLGIWKKIVVLTVCIGGPTESASSGVLPKSVASSTAVKTTPQTNSSLNCIRLKNEPRMSMEVKIEKAVLGANDQYLLRTSPGHINLVNVNGQELFAVKLDSEAREIIWSSDLNGFLILSFDKNLHLLNVEKRKLNKVKEFSRGIRRCTCFENTLLISSDPPEPVIEVYDMKNNFKLINVFRSPLSCKINQRITYIRFNVSGSRLGVIVNGSMPSECFFELRNPNNMHILTTININADKLLPLPTDEFLLHEYTGTKLFLIDKNGQVEKTIEPYDAEKKISAVAFIRNSKCLVRLTSCPYQLHFYDL